MPLSTVAPFLLILVKCLGTASTSVASLPSFYHRSSQVHHEIRRLADKCPGMELEQFGDPGDDDDAAGGRSELKLDAVRFRFPQGVGPQAGHRVAFVFGEHARELVTVESCLHLLRTLCGEVGPQGQAATGRIVESSLGESEVGVHPQNQNALQRLFGDSVSELLIFPNANPVSRKKVEDGDFCLRTNPQGTDLNRNWASHWEGADESAQGDAPPGRKPFSAPETRILRAALAGYRPTFYLSIHSGNLGIFAPYAYAKDAPAPPEQTVSLLEQVSREYCQCPFGGAARTIGYISPGTSLDYVYDTLKAQNSYALEIWIGGEEEQKGFHLRYEAQEAERRGADGAAVLQSLLQRRAATKHKRRKKHVDAQSPKWCLQNFNPVKRRDFDDVLFRWTSAYMELIKKSPLAASMTTVDVAAPRSEASASNLKGPKSGMHHLLS